MVYIAPMSHNSAFRFKIKSNLEQQNGNSQPTRNHTDGDHKFSAAAACSTLIVNFGSISDNPVAVARCGAGLYRCSYIYQRQVYEQCCNLINTNRNNKHIISTKEQLIRRKYLQFTNAITTFSLSLTGIQTRAVMDFCTQVRGANHSAIPLQHKDGLLHGPTDPLSLMASSALTSVQGPAQCRCGHTW